MKRSLLLLATVAAAIGLMAPAAASAASSGLYPSAHKFEASGGSGVQIKGSLAGSCTLTKFTGQVPTAPANVVAEGAVSAPLSAPTATCSGGPSITVAGTEWKLNAGGGLYSAALRYPANGITLRYPSLPGCKLTNASPTITAGHWFNGYPSPVLSRSAWELDGLYLGTWANDGATCAIAGKAENLTVTGSLAITDTTVPTTYIGLGVGF
jgi:hypothetical protein